MAHSVVQVKQRSKGFSLNAQSASENDCIDGENQLIWVKKIRQDYGQLAGAQSLSVLPFSPVLCVSLEYI